MSEMWPCWFGQEQVRYASNLKRQVVITGKAFHTISQYVHEAANNYETGGVLIGYSLGRIYFVLAVTTSNSTENSSKVSFTLDGVEHTKKVNEIVMASGFLFSPSVLGIWHSHIFDGHRFSSQDRISNMVIAKSLGGALSMLVTQSTHGILFSVVHISIAGDEEDCAIKFQMMA